jgi:pimeloyl-ACP methyl ester carboxylesterase
VLQDRTKPNGMTFKLEVAILRQTTPSNEPPLVFLHGGPSGPGGVRGGEMSIAVSWSTKLHRDMIYDQRGAGLSEPKLCVDQTRSAEQTEKLQNTRDPKERQDFYNESARACVASLKAQGIDPDMFGSEINAADLVELRKALGYSKWDLFGASYGGTFVQAAMRRDPKGIRSVVMHSPGLLDGGVEYENPLAYQQVLEHAFAACAAQAPCATAFPTLERDFWELYDELNKNPIDVTVERGNDKLKIRFDGVRFLGALRSNFGQRLSRIPIIINELKRGDRMRAAQYVVAASRAGGNFNNTLTDLVGCYDAYGPDYLKKAAAIVKQAREPFRQFTNELQECTIWHSRFARASDHDPVRSNIPALIFTAEFDHLNPFDFGKRIAGALKTAYHFELPGAIHANMSACPASMMFQFFNNPMQKPDASCLASMPKVAFELKRLERPNLMFTISSADGKATPFQGHWEAAYPNAPALVKVELKINGNDVTGSLSGGPGRKLEIFEGKIAGDTIIFKVKSPEGDRTITFTGKLSGDEIAFTRDVEVPPGGNPGGAFIFGAAGARNFTAKRVE